MSELILTPEARERLRTATLPTSTCGRLHAHAVALLEFTRGGCPSVQRRLDETRVNLARFLARGVFDPRKAAQAFMPVVELAAREYRREHGGALLSGAQRRAVARALWTAEAAEFNATRWGLLRDGGGVS